MPPDSEAAKDEQSPVATQSDAHSEEGEASDGSTPEDWKPRRRADIAEIPRPDCQQPTTLESQDVRPLPDDEAVPGKDSSDADSGADSDADADADANGRDAPPLPNEAPPPQQADDGWDAMWDATRQAWYFYNRFTGLSQWDNPRVPTVDTGALSSSSSSHLAIAKAAISQPTSVAGGYNPAIHGSWDPNAPYAQAYQEAAVPEDQTTLHNTDVTEAADPYVQSSAFNSRTGKSQSADQNPERHSDAAKSHRQMNAYFDVDRAANSHDGRSLKAERRGKQPTKQELAMWKEKRKARKEEKRRAWLRD